MIYHGRQAGACPTGLLKSSPQLLRCEGGVGRGEHDICGRGTAATPRAGSEYVVHAPFIGTVGRALIFRWKESGDVHESDIIITETRVAATGLKTRQSGQRGGKHQ